MMTSPAKILGRPVTATRRLCAVLVLLLTGCASYDGRGLVTGSSRLNDVERVMGPPALRWQAGDGSLQFAYPRGPAGFHTYMVQIAPDGRLSRIENVLDTYGLLRIRSGMSQDEVLRAIGPPNPAGTVYFKARDELVWEWRYCDDSSEPARFYVLFDGATGKVRSTMSQIESLLFEFIDGRNLCGR